MALHVPERCILVQISRQGSKNVEPVEKHCIRKPSDVEFVNKKQYEVESSVTR